MRRRRLPALLLAIVTITAGAGVTGAPAAQAAPAGVPAGRPTAGTGTAVTLITGDRVRTGRDGTTSVHPGPGRKDMKFLSYRAAKSTFVIPADALPLLRAGKLDRRLFDVTALAGFGYTDDRTEELPLLVAYPKAANRQARAAATVPGARVERDLPAVGALAVRADRAGRTELWRSLTGGTPSARSLRPGIEHVWLDGKRTISLDVSVPQIGAPVAWQAGLDGTGVTVAILDTGIDATHPDLAGKIVEARNFTTAPDTDDTVGHGTHVASTIAGSGAASGGRYKGVAPGAKLLIGKVCGDSYCEESDILAGMSWAAERAPVINMSLGGGDAEGIDPLEEAVNGLTAQFGTLFVVAAGNDGGEETVGSPASADAALAVGAVDRDDQLADFSSRGPRVGDHAIKPDITAPGVDIVAARAAHDVIGGPAPVEGYSTLSGTSMATPHVAGAAAILVQQHPDWTPRQRKTVLMGAAKPTPGLDVFGQGAGRVDVAREITQTVAVDEGSLSFAGQSWPHGDDTPVVKTATYRNDGTAAVTLTLAIASTAPAGAFTVADSTLTVPAGGTATTTVTADTGVDGPDGVYSGYLTATAPGGVRVQTPIAVDREVESYDVTFPTLGRDGKPAKDAFVTLYNPETGKLYGVEGGATKRLPKAEYGLYSLVFEGETDVTMLAQPRFAVTGDATVVIDARVAKPITITVPNPAARGTLATINAEWSGDHGFAATLLAFDTEGLYSGQAGPTGKVDTFLGSITASYADPGADESFRNSPYTYDLAYYYPGTMPVGLRKAPKGRDLATIKATYATAAAGAQGLKSNASRYTLLGGGWSVLLPFDLPFRRTEYVNTDGKAKWSADFYQELPAVGDEWPETLSIAWDGPTTYRAGTTHRQEWNKAAFAPSVSDVQYDWDYLVRTGDTIVAGIPAFGEGPGHPGVSTVTSAKLSLYRGTTLVASADSDYAEFEVPPAAAGYRLELTANRGAPHAFSTQVLGTWTFRSGHVAGKTPKRLAASTIRFDPKLDIANSAPAGRLLAVPVHVDHQLGTTTTKLSVEASFDDGRTWKAVRVVGSGDHRTALVRHPSGAGFVSLRGHATDRAGHTADQTVIRAYAIG